MINKLKYIVILFFLVGANASQGQTKIKDMEKEIKQSNPLLCDIETGMCETGEIQNSTSNVEKAPHQKVKLVYFTDPICSSCWGIEPQLRKLKLEYGEHIEIEYRMGGLLPDWSYNSGGISSPSDVASHWDEASRHYDMPIDGDVWLEDPLHSSYPSSIAFKAAQLQSEEMAYLFMRELRELLFLHKKNITKWEHIETAAKAVGLDIKQLQSDYEGKAKNLFQKDLAVAREYGVRGFPTIFVINEEGNRDVVYGSKPYPFYEMAILKTNPNLIKSEYSKKWADLFKIYPTLTAKEFSELSGTPRADSEQVLNKLTKEGKLEKITTKNGSMWKIIK